ncbi:hypothetical protein P9239_22180 [Caballeronia sp. LZ062]|uniref:hypothetical protein n=1 Tax=unclassified Caballeronia TaxID=2646786 RepID=UPI0028674FA8|nr:MULTISPECIES: hypothetical protein [unclassified Caballeronia]MDR5856392.1 hypothetical protein [Caballeronia sp. LZ050]MDR5873062.1 hypothetical protein [Caballeronia sp. LZ062]
MFNELVLRRGVRWMLLVVMYYVVAAASYNGYFTKWQFRDQTPEWALPAMLDGTIDRPFVYRQLLPMLANGVEHAMPAKLKARVDGLLMDDNRTHHPITWFYPSASDARNPQYALRYYLIFGMSFTAFFLAMFAMRAVCMTLQANRTASTLAPMALAVIFPLILTDGAYFYDFPELLFMMLAVWLAATGRTLWLIPLTAIATLNKESFLFFTLTLFPFLHARMSLSRALTLQAVMLAIAGAINLAVKMKYAANSGDVAQFHLFHNFDFLIHPLSYLRFEYNYGVVMSKGFNVINIVIAVVLLRSGWSKLPLVMRRHVWIALAVNVPLFITFGFHDELRNLSMLIVGLLMILCVNIALVLAYERAGATVDAENDALATPQSAPLRERGAMARSAR